MKASTRLAAGICTLLIIGVIGYRLRSVIHGPGQSRPEIITSGRPLVEAA